ncbi:DUF5412 domain-containing protein [Planococcus shenhongbingii]|uniref:DUF5412 domain-containing protein n=1 Tax=Planococcus shenhongbingii TaxID=3058398 RepID=UPI003463749E
MTKPNVEECKKKKSKKLLKRFIIAGLLVAATAGYGVYWAFFDMGRLPTGKFLTEETSPDGKYTLKAFAANGGATTAYAVRGELVLNEEGCQTENIYWNYRETKAIITWKDTDTVMINGHPLDVPDEKFDFRASMRYGPLRGCSSKSINIRFIRCL